MNPNPYTVLDIRRDAATADIARAVPNALKERKYSANDIARAQKLLMNPVQRMVVEFLTLRSAPTQRPKRAPTAGSTIPELPMPELSDAFDKLDELTARYQIK